MKKLIAFAITMIFLINSQAMAFSFKKKKVDPLDLKEKTEYVNMEFFSHFDDPYLSFYIYEAVKNNHDARKASWQVEEYRQNIKYSFGQELPHLNVSANYAGIHIPKLDNFQLKSNAFILPFMLSYEPDFFLKNRDKTKSVKKSFEAAKYQEKSIYISLASDTASAYINLLQYDKLIALQEQIIKVKQEQLLREQKKYDRGVIDNTQLNAVKKELETAKNNLETYNKNRATVLTQLAVLTGISPTCTCDIQRAAFDNFDYRSEIPSQASSDVIFSRPDVMEAEANLEKAKIDIRVARKEFLPSFNITGVWIFNTIAPGSFFSWQSSLAAILAGATQDIFKGGMKLANLRIQKAKYEQLFENYRQTDLTAVKEVNDALCIIKFDTNVDNNTITYLNLQKRDFLDMNKKLHQGVISYPEFLSEQERLLNIEQNQTQTKTQRIADYLTLYKAVGGKL